MTINMVVRRAIEITDEAEDEIAALPPRFRRAMVAAIDLLEHQADVETKHRHPLAGELVLHWQVEVDAYRVYYVFDRASVTVKAVRLKGNRRTKEVFEP